MDKFAACTGIYVLLAAFGTFMEVGSDIGKVWTEMAAQAPFQILACLV